MLATRGVLTASDAFAVLFPFLIDSNAPLQKSVESLRHGKRIPKDYPGGGQELDRQSLIGRSKTREQISVEDVVDARSAKDEDEGCKLRV